MASITETASWEPSIYRIETTDPVIGGEDGISNVQAKLLGNRTLYLKGVADDHEERVEDLETNSSNLLRSLGSGAFVKHGMVTGSLTNNVFDFITVAKISTSPVVNRVTLTANSVSPLIVTFSKGYDANGPIVYYGRVTSNQVINLGNNLDALIYAEYNESTGELSFGATNATTSHVVSYSDPGTTGYWYSLKDEKLYLWNGSVWQNVVQVVIGRANWSGSGSFTLYQPVGKSIKDIYGRGQIPAGTVSAFAGATAPDGYLVCNGGAISRTIFSDLFAAVGTTYGAGNGTTTFNIPDLRGEFLRGLDGGRGVDSGRALGSYQADELKAHTHTYRGATIIPSGSDPTGTGSTFTTGNTGSTGGTETRPRNVAMNYLIKF